VVETVFDLSSFATTRLAAIHAAIIVNRYGLPSDFRLDLEQEARLELWRKRSTYDARRGSRRTFSERVVANRMTSLVRTMYSTRSGQFREEPLHDRLGLAAASDNVELRIDVARVLAGLPLFDRRVAALLTRHSPSQTGRTLRISRASVYRAIGRLRGAFAAGGFASRPSRPSGDYRPNCDLRLDACLGASR
jgi:DNA-directed RNA polymerase specialized sigma24 family protein